MPYKSISDSKLPDYVKKRSDEIKRKWIEIFNAAFDKYGESKAFLIANTWLKKQSQGFVKRSSLVFTVDRPSEGFIKRSDDGNEYVDLVLNSTETHKDGKKFSAEMLQKWADYINKNPNLVGDVDHSFYDKVLNSSLSNDQIRSVLKSKPGIAKAVRAVFEDGKLWVRAFIDKRYRNLINKAKGVSAEAFCTWSDDDTAIDGELLGFTFNVRTTPADNLAGVVA